MNWGISGARYGLRWPVAFKKRRVDQSPNKRGDNASRMRPNEVAEKTRDGEYEVSAGGRTAELDLLWIKIRAAGNPCFRLQLNSLFLSNTNCTMRARIHMHLASTNKGNCHVSSRQRLK